MKTGPVRLLTPALLALALGGPAAPVSVASGNLGYRADSSAAVPGSLTASKAESKLWFNRGWWASMLDPANSRFYIFRLDRSKERWVSTGTPLDARSNSRADTLWDAARGKLYVASHVINESGAAVSAPAKLWRFSYDRSSNSYTLDAGFPVTISDAASETLVIAKDSTGTLWATWTQAGQVYVSHTTSSDAAWRTPYVLPAAGSTVHPDDISSIIAFRNRIGVMWSNALDGRFFFATHEDGAGDGASDWSSAPIATTAPRDDHINMKADNAGRVYAAVKFTTTGGDPMIALLVRDATFGTWSQHTVATARDSNTRPIVLLDEDHQEIHVFSTGPEPPSTTGQNGGTIYQKTSPLNALAFPIGAGTPVIRDTDSPALNDVTSAKQSVSTAGGIIVLANNQATRRYWHADIRLDGSAPPPPTLSSTSRNVPGTTFAADADAYVRSNSPALNYGGIQSLRVKQPAAADNTTYRSYLRFAVSGLTSRVTSAALRLKAATTNSDGGDVFAGPLAGAKPRSRGTTPPHSAHCRSRASAR